ncbi:MAG: non-ribosomal peptide synthetase [Mycobacteriales bacterium]
MADALPLSFGQEQLWFLDQLAPGEPTYNVGNAVRLRGPLDAEALRAGLELVVRRHEVIRSAFGARDGTPYRTVLPATAGQLPVTDLTGVPALDREAELTRAVQAEADLPFDLEVGPLYRCRLFRVAPADHVLVTTFHHIVMDGWSAGLMNAELATAYRALRAGVEPVLPELDGDYTGFVEEQREQLSGEALEAELRFWEQRLAGLATLELPADRLRPPVRSSSGSSLLIDFPPELTASLRTLATENAASLFMVLAAALAAVLARYTGTEDVPLGVTMLGRTTPEREAVVGLFVNMAVLRADVTGDPTFLQLLDRVVDAHFDIYDHQDVPFEKVVERARPIREAGRNPLFQVSVQLLGAGTSGALDLDDLDAELLQVGTSQARFDLNLNFYEVPTGLRLWLGYSTDLFDRWRVEALGRHLQTLLAGAAAEPDRPVSRLPLLDPDERAALLAAGDGGHADYSTEPVHVDVARVARATPDALAAVCRGAELTYGELDEQADRLARWLRAQGVRAAQVVALALERDLDVLVAMLGVLKAGAAFTVVDPQHPPARLDYMLRDTDTPLVITRSTLAHRLPAGDWATLALDTEWDAVQAVPVDGRLEEWATRDSLMYVLYTSGSTGRPKGVMIEHRGLTCFTEAFRRTFDFGPGDRLLQLPALTFDMSQGEIFTALRTGAALVLVDRESGSSPDALAALMREQRVTYAGLSPVMLSLVEAEPYPDLRYVMGGAEALPAELVTKWNQPGRRFVNLYGPTEASIACTEYECEHIEWQSSPPIGHPELERLHYVVDRRDELVPFGVPGELLIGGDEGLARGYLNQPELTGEKFVADPVRPDARVYRSGDLVRWTPAGELEFLGRIDTQVKLRGLRIELGEVESALLTHPQVRMATVLLRPDRHGDNRLVGYLTAAGEPPEPGVLRRHLAGLLPDYMVPTAWVVLAEFPLTAARKIDRAALPEPVDEVGDGGEESGFVPPATDTEREVAGVIAEILERPRVSAADNVFQLGGSSLQAMRMVSRLNKTFRVKVNVRLLYGSSSVAEVAAAIDRLLAVPAR